MLLLAIAVRAELRCPFAVTLSASVETRVQSLSAGDCLTLNATGRHSRSSYWIAASTGTVAVARYACAWRGVNCTLAWAGSSPDTRLFEKVRHPNVQYSFTAVTGTLLSLTYADLAEFRCDRVIGATASPWTFSVKSDDPIRNRTCLLTASPGPKDANITWLNCTSNGCGTVLVYGAGTWHTGFVKNVTALGTTQLFHFPSALLLVIEPTANALEVTVESGNYTLEKDIMVEWPSEGVLPPKNSDSKSTDNLPILILTALIALLLHTAVGFVWIREHKVAREFGFPDAERATESPVPLRPVLV
jgi:hypothetical protein